MNLIDRVPQVGETRLGRAVLFPMADEPAPDDEVDDLFGQVSMMPESFGDPCNQQLDPYDMDPTNPLSPMYLDRPEIEFEDELTNFLPDQWQHKDDCEIEPWAEKAWIAGLQISRQGRTRKPLVGLNFDRDHIVRASIVCWRSAANYVP